jgi:hypothetical protein
MTRYRWATPRFPASDHAAFDGYLAAREGERRESRRQRISQVNVWEDEGGFIEETTVEVANTPLCAAPNIRCEELQVSRDQRAGATTAITAQSQ